MTEILRSLSDLSNTGVNPTILNIFIIMILFYLWDIKIHPIIKRISYNKLMNSRSKSDANMIDLLHQYQELMLCDRLSIYEFHNMTHNLYGKSFLKFTCTYEVTRLGVHKYNINNKDVPTGSYKEILKLISDRDPIIIESVKGSKLTPELINFLNEGRVKSGVILPITFKGMIYGFMTIDFVRAEQFSNENLDGIIRNAHILIGEISSKICKGI